MMNIPYIYIYIYICMYDMININIHLDPCNYIKIEKKN